MKPDRHYKMSKAAKIQLALLKANQNNKADAKALYIKAELYAKDAERNPHKLRCSDGAPMWA